MENSGQQYSGLNVPGIITYNGVASNLCDIFVEVEPNYTYPSRSYTFTHIPGRNGDIAQGGDSYQNVTRTYNIAIMKSTQLNLLTFPQMANKISEWLHSASSYARLTDTFEPNYYRMAIYEEEKDVQNILCQAGRAEISFNCKPQRYLISGETGIPCQDGSLTVTNPTGFKALPKIVVSGSGAGAITVGSRTVTISDIGSSFTIDSDLQDAYSDTENRNPYISCDEFPSLGAGETNIAYSGGITSIVVYPRWWTL